jgi:hypothetical protein
VMLLVKKVRLLRLSWKDAANGRIRLQVEMHIAGQVRPSHNASVLSLEESIKFRQYILE